MVDALISPEQALEALGSPFVAKFDSALDATRGDFARFKKQLPTQWWAHWTERALAGVIHDRLWSNLTHNIEEEVPGVSTSDNGTTRSICVNDRVILRIKRHTEEGQISGYRTRASGDFYMGTLAGMEIENLAVGYEWLRDAREIGRAVLSKQRSTNAEPVWVIGLRPAAGGIVSLPYDPIIPPQSEFDLTEIVASNAEEANSR